MKLKPDQKWLKKVGKKIKEGRECLGLTQLELSSRIGVYPATIINIEKGMFCPMLPNAIKIAKVLDTTVEKLFGEGV